MDFNRTLYNPETGGLNTGAARALHWLNDAGCEICVVTKPSKDGMDRRAQIKSLGLNWLLRGVVVINGKNKQDSDFEECRRLMGSLPPDRIVVVGDRIVEEIAIGVKMGMFTVWLKSGMFATELPRTRDETPHRIILNLGELPSCLSDMVVMPRWHLNGNGILHP